MYEDLSSDSIRDALSFLSSDCERDEWVRIGMAIKSYLGDAGFDIWDAWSQQAPSYNAKSARSTWRSIEPDGGIGIGTLIKAAKDAGYRIESARRLSPEDIEQRNVARMASMQEFERQEKEKHDDAAKLAQSLWQAAQFIPGTPHPYITKKRIKIPENKVKIGTYTRFGVSIDNCILIPIRDAAKNITSLQAIFPETHPKLERDRDYLPGGKKKDCYFTLGNIPPGGAPARIAICEGFATGCSVFEAMDCPTVIAFDAGNLRTVAKIMRDKFPHAEIIICADNDRFKESGNTGLHRGKEAAIACGGILRFPQFKAEHDDTKPTDFNDLHILEGLDAIRSQINQSEETRIEDVKKNAPFRILGHDSGNYFFYQNEKKQIVALTSGSMSSNSLCELADNSFWEQTFPAKSGFDKSAAINFLIRSAHAAGIYDPNRVRGRGAWIDADRTVFHFGSALWVDGNITPVDEMVSEYVYPAAIPIARPSASVMSDEDGKRIIDLTKQFRWNKPASAPLLCGWLALAPVCGALPWRPHVWVTGGAASGKSTVMSRLIHPLLAKMNLFALGNSTEAGIRQTLRNDALPVLIDESEQNNEREESRMQNIISLIRQASSETGAITYKGTATGESSSFMVRSMFMLSSIQVGLQHQADFERITILSLRSAKEEGKSVNQNAQWEALKAKVNAIHADRTLPERMFMRSLTLLPTTLANIDTFTRAASLKFNSVRAGDQYGTLMAGCWSLMDSGLATLQQATDMIDSFDWNEYRENTETDEAEKFTHTLLQSRIRVNQIEVSVSELIHTCIQQKNIVGGIDPQMADEHLQRYGMRVMSPWIYIAVKHTGLESLLSKTSFKNGIRDQLNRIPDCKRGVNQRISHVPTRCTQVPLEQLDPDFVPF